MSGPAGFLAVLPSRLAVGEPFALEVKVRGPVREAPQAGHFNTYKPGLAGPFNLNPSRGIRYMDDTLPEWTGRLDLLGADDLDGDASLVFDGEHQGVFPGDPRPIARFEGYRFTRPGFHFLQLRDPASGAKGRFNPVFVTPEPPAARLVWGDPHWQTFFSDGIRCPEELYAFARNEAFLDWGAISDHMEGVTDRQWDYFQAVTNDWNEPGRFATLHGQEWTHHDPARGAPGHRNVYVRGDGAPPFRSNAPDCDTLEKLWARLDASGVEAVAIPHHSANVTMGVDWDLGWHPTYETVVEIHSVWGSSECPAEAGNPYPIRSLGGEKAGQHVVDALNRGYRLGFVGGGDIHDGRPGDDLHPHGYPEPAGRDMRPQGFTAAFVPALTREAVFDAIRDRRTYATTKRRIYLDWDLVDAETAPSLRFRAASEEGIARIEIIRNGVVHATLAPHEEEPRRLETEAPLGSLGPHDYAYVRVRTADGHLAWSSPVWGTGCTTSH